MQIKTTHKTTPAIAAQMIASNDTFLSSRNWYNLSNCEINPITTNSKKMIKSTIRSATIVPNALSNGTFSYFLSNAARVISPDLGIVKFTRYETQTVSKSFLK